MQSKLSPIVLIQYDLYRLDRKRTDQKKRSYPRDLPRTDRRVRTRSSPTLADKICQFHAWVSSLNLSTDGWKYTFNDSDLYDVYLLMAYVFKRVFYEMLGPKTPEAFVVKYAQKPGRSSFMASQAARVVED